MVVPGNARKSKSSSKKNSGKRGKFKWSTLWNAQSKFMLDHYDGGEHFEGQLTDGSEQREEAFNIFWEEVHKTKAKYKSEPYKYTEKTQPIDAIPVSITTDLYGIKRVPSDFLLYYVIGLSILVFCVESVASWQRLSVENFGLLSLLPPTMKETLVPVVPAPGVEATASQTLKTSTPLSRLMTMITRTHQWLMKWNCLGR